MTSPFDRMIDRHDTNSIKWDLYGKDVLPMWVADMDFAAPPAIIEALNKFTVTALADPAVKEKLAEQGLTAVGNSPAQFRDYIAAETAKWAKVIRDAGIPTAK